MTITDWFTKKGSYAEGLIILSQIPHVSNSLIQSLQHEMLSNLLKLKYELKRLENDPIYLQSLKPKKLVLKAKPIQIKQEKELFKKSIETEFEKESLAMYPVELHETYRTRIANFYEMCSLKIQLNKLDPDASAEALEIILKIEDLQAKILQAWKVLNYWRENNRFLIENTATDFYKLTPTALFKKKNNLESTISKREKTLDSIKKALNNEPKNRVKQNLFLRKTEQLEQLKTDLEQIRLLIKSES